MQVSLEIIVLSDLNITPLRPMVLRQEIIEILKSIKCVEQIIAFGSLARGDWDRWSDIDLLLIVQNHADVLTLYEVIKQEKQILYNHPLTLAEPYGVHCLGTIFEDESVFTCVDFNFLSMADARQPDALSRFAQVEILYNRLSNETEQNNTVYPQQELTPRHAEIATAIHFLKKAIKQSLRGNHDSITTIRRKETLATIMRKYADDYGNIGEIASRYLDIAQALLENDG